MHPEHARDTGTVEIHIQKTNPVTLARESQRQVHGGHALADAALPAHDDQLMPDAGHAILDLPRMLGELLHHLRIIGVL